jgi:hypothetical protein
MGCARSPCSTAYPPGRATAASSAPSSSSRRSSSPSSRQPHADGIFYFGDTLLTFFLAWLLAFIISPIVTAIVAAIPRLPREARDGPRLHGDRGGAGLPDPRGRRRRCRARSASSSRRCRTSARTCTRSSRRCRPGSTRSGSAQVDLATQAHGGPRQPRQDRRAAHRPAPVDRRRPASGRSGRCSSSSSCRSTWSSIATRSWPSSSGWCRPRTRRRHGCSRPRRPARSGLPARAGADGLRLLRGRPVAHLALGLGLTALSVSGGRRAHGDPVLRSVHRRGHHRSSWRCSPAEAFLPTLVIMGIGWLRGHERPAAADHAGRRRHPPDRRPRLGAHRLAHRGHPGAIFGIPIAAVVSAFFFHFLHRTRATGAWPAAPPSGLERTRGRAGRVPREPTPGQAVDVRTMSDDPTTPTSADAARAEAARESARPTARITTGRADQPDMTRERARSERRDLDKERGEPLAGGPDAAARAPCARPAGRCRKWTSRPRILVTNDRRRRVARAARPQAGARADG